MAVRRLGSALGGSIGHYRERADLPLPSPLATSAVAGPLAVALRERGHEAVVADNGGTDPEQVLARFVSAAQGAAVVVPHSNAGRFGPAVADAVGARLVCLDSLLPDGLLAPWSTWWPREDIQAVVGEHWKLLTTDEPRVPLNLLTEQPPAPENWLAQRSGYVAFGHAYNEQKMLVEAHHWEVRRLDGMHLHLHLLIAPDEVAEGLLEVVSRLG